MSGLALTGAHPGPAPGLRPASYNTDHGDGAATSTCTAVCRCCHHTMVPARFVDTTRSWSLSGAQSQMGQCCQLLLLLARWTGFLLCTLPRAQNLAGPGLVTDTASHRLFLGAPESLCSNLTPQGVSSAAKSGCRPVHLNIPGYFLQVGNHPIQMLSAEKWTFSCQQTRPQAVVR